MGLLVNAVVVGSLYFVSSLLSIADAPSDPGWTTPTPSALSLAPVLLETVEKRKKKKKTAPYVSIIASEVSILP